LYISAFKYLIISGLYFGVTARYCKSTQNSSNMRRRFEQQLSLGVIPIPEVELDFRSRHSLVPLFRGLQHAFETPALNEKIFAILAKKILVDKKQTGRYGMSLWEILVLGTVKLNLNADYDELHDMCINHHSFRCILGIQRSDFKRGKEYSLQSIKDNVQLLDAEVIEQIIDIIAAGAHDIIKKKEGAASLDLHVKGDSFVVESDIHFPTDLNLLWDSLRKSLETIGYYQSQGIKLAGWREWRSYHKQGRSLYRTVSEIHRKKGANYQPRLRVATKRYLDFSGKVSEKLRVAVALLTQLSTSGNLTNRLHQKRLGELKHYLAMVDKHIDLVHRRIILGQTIPHSEKVFSIFEPHVEWNSKGKANCPVELGHNVVVATDQYGFILYGEVYEQTVDKQATQRIGEQLEQKHGQTNQLASISFDKNFYSAAAETSLEKRFAIVVLPKAGKPSKKQLAKEENTDYRQVKLEHSKIEGNINELEHHGLGLCRDKGIQGFKRYVAYGMLSYNLTKLGRMLIQVERASATTSQRRRAA